MLSSPPDCTTISTWLAYCLAKSESDAETRISACTTTCSWGCAWITMSPNLCSSQIFCPLWTGNDLSNVRVYSSRADAHSGIRKLSRTRLIFRIMVQELVQSLLFLAVEIGERGLQANIETVRCHIGPRLGDRGIEQRQAFFFIDDCGRRSRRQFGRGEFGKLFDRLAIGGFSRFHFAERLLGEEIRRGRRRRGWRCHDRMSPEPKRNGYRDRKRSGDGPGLPLLPPQDLRFALGLERLANGRPQRRRVPLFVQLAGGGGNFVPKT